MEENKSSQKNSSTGRNIDELQEIWGSWKKSGGGGTEITKDLVTQLGLECERAFSSLMQIKDSNLTALKRDMKGRAQPLPSRVQRVMTSYTKAMLENAEPQAFTESDFYMNQIVRYHLTKSMIRNKKDFEDMLTKLTQAIDHCLAFYDVLHDLPQATYHRLMAGSYINYFTDNKEGPPKEPPIKPTGEGGETFFHTNEKKYAMSLAKGKTRNSKRMVNRETNFSQYRTFSVFGHYFLRYLTTEDENQLRNWSEGIRKQEELNVINSNPEFKNIAEYLKAKIGQKSELLKRPGMADSLMKFYNQSDQRYSKALLDVADSLTERIKEAVKTSQEEVEKFRVLYLKIVQLFLKIEANNKPESFMIKKSTPTREAVNSILQKFSQAVFDKSEIQLVADYFVSLPAKKGKSQRDDLMRPFKKDTYSDVEALNMVLEDKFCNSLLSMCISTMQDQSSKHDMVKSVTRRDGLPTGVKVRWENYLQDYLAGHPLVYLKQLKPARPAKDSNSRYELSPINQIIFESKCPTIRRLFSPNNSPKTADLSTSRVCFDRIVAFPQSVTDQPAYYERLKNTYLDTTFKISHEYKGFKWWLRRSHLLEKALLAHHFDFTNDQWLDCFFLNVASLQSFKQMAYLRDQVMSSSMLRIILTEVMKLRMLMSHEELLKTEFCKEVKKIFEASFRGWKMLRKLKDKILEGINQRKEEAPGSTEGKKHDELIQFEQKTLIPQLAVYHLLFADASFALDLLPSAACHYQPFEGDTWPSEINILADNIEDLFHLESNDFNKRLSQEILLRRQFDIINCFKLTCEKVEANRMERSGEKVTRFRNKKTVTTSNQLTSRLDLYIPIFDNTSVDLKDRFTSVILKDIKHLKRFMIVGKQSFRHGLRPLSLLCNLMKTSGNPETLRDWLAATCFKAAIEHFRDGARNRHKVSMKRLFIKSVLEESCSLFANQEEFGNLYQDFVWAASVNLEEPAHFVDELLKYVDRSFGKNHKTNQFCSYLVKDALKTFVDHNEITQINNAYIKPEHVNAAGHQVTAADFLKSIYEDESSSLLSPGQLLQIKSLAEKNHFQSVVLTNTFTVEQKLEYLCKGSYKPGNPKLVAEQIYTMKQPWASSYYLQYLAGLHDIDSPRSELEELRSLCRLSDSDFDVAVKHRWANQDQRDVYLLSAVMSKSLAKIKTIVECGLDSNLLRDLLHQETAKRLFKVSNENVFMYLYDEFFVFWKSFCRLLAVFVFFRKGIDTKTKNYQTTEITGASVDDMVTLCFDKHFTEFSYFKMEMIDIANLVNSEKNRETLAAVSKFANMFSDGLVFNTEPACWEDLDMPFITFLSSEIFWKDIGTSEPRESYGEGEEEADPTLFGQYKHSCSSTVEMIGRIMRFEDVFLKLLEAEYKKYLQPFADWESSQALISYEVESGIYDMARVLRKTLTKAGKKDELIDVVITLLNILENDSNLDNQDRHFMTTCSMKFLASSEILKIEEAVKFVKTVKNLEVPFKSLKAILELVKGCPHPIKLDPSDKKSEVSRERDEGEDEANEDERESEVKEGDKEWMTAWTYLEFGLTLIAVCPDRNDCKELFETIKTIGIDDSDKVNFAIAVLRRSEEFETCHDLNKAAWQSIKSYLNEIVKGQQVNFREDVHKPMPDKTVYSYLDLLDLVAAHGKDIASNPQIISSKVFSLPVDNKAAVLAFSEKCVKDVFGRSDPMAAICKVYSYWSSIKTWATRYSPLSFYSRTERLTVDKLRGFPVSYYPFESLNETITRLLICTKDEDQDLQANQGCMKVSLAESKNARGDFTYSVHGILKWHLGSIGTFEFDPKVKTHSSTFDLLAFKKHLTELTQDSLSRIDPGLVEKSFNKGPEGIFSDDSTISSDSKKSNYFSTSFGEGYTATESVNVKFMNRCKLNKKAEELLDKEILASGTKKRRTDLYPQALKDFGISVQATIDPRTVLATWQSTAEKVN